MSKSTSIRIQREKLEKFKDLRILNGFHSLKQYIEELIINFLQEPFKIIPLKKDRVRFSFRIDIETLDLLEFYANKQPHLSHSRIIEALIEKEIQKNDKKLQFIEQNLLLEIKCKLKELDEKKYLFGIPLPSIIYDYYYPKLCNYEKKIKEEYDMKVPEGLSKILDKIDDYMEKDAKYWNNLDNLGRLILKSKKKSSTNKKILNY